jgi:hypothetical protein
MFSKPATEEPAEGGSLAAAEVVKFRKGKLDLRPLTLLGRLGFSVVYRHEPCSVLRTATREQIIGACETNDTVHSHVAPGRDQIKIASGPSGSILGYQSRTSRTMLARVVGSCFVTLHL